MHAAVMNSFGCHRYAEAIERSLKGLEIDPDYFLLRLWLGCAYQLEARYPKAIRELQTAVDLCGRGVSWVVGALGYAHAVAGNNAEALLILEELLDPTKRAIIDFLSVALTYAGLGDIVLRRMNLTS